MTLEGAVKRGNVEFRVAIPSTYVEPASDDPEGLGPIITCQVCEYAIALQNCEECGKRVCEFCGSLYDGVLLCSDCAEEKGYGEEEEKAVEEEEEEDDEPLLIKPEGWETEPEDPE